MEEKNTSVNHSVKLSNGKNDVLLKEKFNLLNDDENSENNNFDSLEQMNYMTDSIFDKLNLSHIKSNKNSSPNTKNHLDAKYIPKVLSKIYDLDYHMDHKCRGKCIIINNTYFNSETLPERKGTQIDRDSLIKCFKELAFDVINWDEKNANEIKNDIDSLSKEDFSDHDCLVICALTHGDASCLYAKDTKYYIDHLFEPFKSDLSGKPKIFIIQACRGDRLDNGSIINFDVEDSNSSSVRIPKWTDFLMAYSTIPGYYSWRNIINGSWYIQSFVSSLSKYYKEHDLLSILTITNQKVAYDYESNTPNLPDSHQCKQIPMISSTLTRKIYFNKPKKFDLKLKQ